MKKKIYKNPDQVNSDILPEYDFKSGIRGKHHIAYRSGHKVKIHKADGTTILQYFTLEDGAVMLEPDVREYFPDSEAVNKALRSLISLIPGRKNKKKYNERTLETKA